MADLFCCVSVRGASFASLKWHATKKTTVSEMQLHDYYIFFSCWNCTELKVTALVKPLNISFLSVCVCVCRGQNIFICKRPTLQESSRCCAIVETFSTTVRSRDCVACEMNVTVSMGTSVIPNFLAAKDILTHTFRTRWHFYDQIGFCKYFLLCPGLSTTAQIHMETILGFLFRYF